MLPEMVLGFIILAVYSQDEWQVRGICLCDSAGVTEGERLLLSVRKSMARFVCYVQVYSHALTAVKARLLLTFLKEK